MRRLAGVSGATAGADGLFMGETHLGPGVRSGAHHHGPSETAIYVVSGNPVFVFRAGEELVRLGVTDPALAEKRASELQAQVFASEDAKEGATAFVEKRAPIWRGR